MTAYFGGTFDPVHIGHVNLLVRLKEQANVSRVVVAPSPYTPLKEHKKPLISVQHRLRMLELAFSELSYVEVLLLEEGEGPFYLVDTFKTHFEKGTYLFFGEDVLETLEQWKAVDELFEYGKPLIGTRSPVSNLHEKSARIKNSVVTIPQYTVSSTEIRDRLATKKFCEHLVPLKVLDYIYKNDLYCS